MGNITQLHQGSLNGLRRQTNECLENAYNKGYQDGKLDFDNGQAEYNKGLEDARLTTWTMLTSKNTGEIFAEYRTVSDILGSVPMKEIRDRIEAYEREKQAETEIQVGDEVITRGEKIAVVTRVEDNCVRVMFKDGSGFREQHTINELKKTGRHFDEIEQLLDKLREEQQ